MTLRTQPRGRGAMKPFKGNDPENATKRTGSNEAIQRKPPQERNRGGAYVGTMSAPCRQHVCTMSHHVGNMSATCQAFKTKKNMIICLNLAFIGFVCFSLCNYSVFIFFVIFRVIFFVILIFIFFIICPKCSPCYIFIYT